MNKLFLTTSVLTVLLATTSLAADARVKHTVAPQVTSYQMDPTHTQVVFQYNHFGFSNITGRFDEVKGDVRFDPKNVGASSVRVHIPIQSIDTGVDALDEHLLNKDFFDQKTFPNATFVSKHVQPLDAKRFLIHGDLTIKGVTKPVELNAVINGVGVHPMSKVPAVGFDASTVIKRSEFGLGMYAPNVSDEVKIQITVEATDSSKKKGA